MSIIWCGNIEGKGTILRVVSTQTFYGQNVSKKCMDKIYGKSTRINA